MQPFVHDRFWRGDTSRRERTHSGPGLAIETKIKETIRNACAGATLYHLADRAEMADTIPFARFHDKQHLTRNAEIFRIWVVD